MRAHPQPAAPTSLPPGHLQLSPNAVSPPSRGSWCRLASQTDLTPVSRTAGLGPEQLQGGARAGVTSVTSPWLVPVPLAAVAGPGQPHTVDGRASQPWPTGAGAGTGGSRQAGSLAGVRPGPRVPRWRHPMWPSTALGTNVSRLPEPATPGHMASGVPCLLQSWGQFILPPPT